MELALGQKHGQVALLALDWQKAFGAIHWDALIMALERFGSFEASTQTAGSR